MRDDLTVLRMKKEKDVLQFFPPHVAVEIKALACELPSQFGVPLSRFTSRDIAQLASERGIVAKISGATVWRWLNEDAIKPWQYRSWIFPRDPDFQEKAGRVLDLYHGMWEGRFLGRDEYVISTDEKTSIQARNRKHITVPPNPGQSIRVEHEYKREGALAYLAAWDVRQAKIFGCFESSTGIEPFERLVEQVMNQDPYKFAKRVFWVMDNGSSHRGDKCIKRLIKKWPTIVPVHLPIHASWLNQIEIYFSIVERKVLTPNDFSSLEEVKERLLEFQKTYEKLAKPFEWKFTKKDLEKLMKKINPKIERLACCA